jgi:AraC-like DNA-binding protein/ligand-binding sensor protein
MAKLSKRMMGDVAKHYRRDCGLRAVFLDLSGEIVLGRDNLTMLSNTRRRRDYALQESISVGGPYIYRPVPGLTRWLFGLEDRRMIHGTLMGGEVMLEDSARADSESSEPFYESIKYLIKRGFDRDAAEKYITTLPVMTYEQVEASALQLYEIFYQVSGWNPTLMRENKLRLQQQQQFNQAIQDQKREGVSALYAFEKERVLLANIRAGDRSTAMRILNEMLSTIYMSSPRFVVLRARAVELMSYLTRAAIEDNPLLEPLIEKNHRWIESLILSKSFEDLSYVLMDSLNDFIDEVHLHGLNRSNVKVRKALDFVGANYMRRIGLRDVANEVGLSSFRLAHLVKEHTGKTITQTIQHVRVQQARVLLERTSKSCAEIAYDVGFGDQSYFIMHFRRIMGVTPAKYRRRIA